MRIVFINAVLGGDFSALDISITQLATYLNERTGHRASITDLTFHRRHWRKLVYSDIRKKKPDIIGISCSTLYLQHIKKIARFIKENFGLPIILGGYHPSIDPDDTIKMRDVDAISMGDGEFALTEYMNRLQDKKSAKGIKGIWAKEGGKIVKNDRGCFVSNIDQFPIPNWDLWVDLDRYFYYLGMLYFLGNRGCPYRCSHCDAHQISDSVAGQYFRTRDPVKYADEIIYQWKKYEKKGMRFAQMFDQVPTMDRNWLKAFTDRYIQKGDPKKYHYSMFSRIDHLDEEKIQMLAKSGCKILRMGVESGNSFIRREIHKKKTTIPQIRKVFALCKKYGVGMTAFYMVGGPAENIRTINQTIRLARQLDANRSAFFVYKPVTKESEELIKKYGGEIDTKRWNKADNFTFDAVVRLKDLSPRQVEMLQYKAYLLTFSKRWSRLFASNPLAYPGRLAVYMYRGIYDGLDMRYLFPYFHIYGYDYVNR